jgi:hypothetical protein
MIKQPVLNQILHSLSKEAQQVAKELSDTYINRPAFLDELSKL